MPSKQDPVRAVEDERGLQPTLTAAEREAIEIAAAELDDEYYGTNCKKELAAAATLRKLLERNDHDAAPEAIANADGEPAPKCGGEAGLSSREGTGNTPSEAEINALEFVVEEGRIGNYGILRSWLIRLRPEWESQSYEESNEKRVNTNTKRVIDRAAYEGDIVSRLKHWRGLHLAHGGELFEEAAAEIAQLREAIRRLAEQDATLSVQGGSVTVTLDATLTDAEREAIEAAVNFCECTDKPLPRSEQITALRKMCGDSDTERCATPPRDVALSGCETVPDPDSRVWETWRTPQPQATMANELPIIKSGE